MDIDKLIEHFFQVWLVSCERNFPSPPLWRTLRESCLRWRHRLALVEQWNRVCLALTARLLHIMYGPMFPELKISMCFNRPQASMKLAHCSQYTVL